MARIRSIHPGLFTDEAYMSLSLAAKACWPGIWTEADDQGVFEWKPLTLKARLLPAENVDMAAVLAELVEKGLVSNFECEGKHYGAIKGFGNWQKPKKPLHRFPLPEQLRTFVAWKPPKEEPVPNQFPTPTTEVEQREEGGGKRKEEESESSSPETTAGSNAAKPHCLPPDWKPSEEGRAYALTRRLNPDRVAEAFVDYWTGGKGAKQRRTDWNRTWRVWCDRETPKAATAPAKLVLQV